MTADPVIDLRAPFTTDRLLQVRSGKMKAMPGLKIESGIDKTLCNGPVYVNNLGIEGDEHDLTFHGGVDKAIHGYCSSHYAAWQEEFPSAADRFRPGGFGENFVTAHMNERNVCVGDVIAVGDEDGLLLEVSLPRQPCFKLNHRFQLKNFAPNTWRTSRTGWYYRVLRPGTVRAGDEIHLVDRRHPGWTIERIQEFLHRNQGDAAANEALAAIEQLGAESRNAFKNRVAKQKAKEKKAAQAQEEAKVRWRDFRLVEKTAQTSRITSFVFEAVVPIADPEYLSEGSHVKIRLGNGLVRAYSIVDGDRNRFQLGVALDEKSRGGSRYLHETVRVGDVIQVGTMSSSLPMVSSASNHIFLAGGVGLTAFLALIEGFLSINYSATLHYAVRSADDVPFRARLEKLGDAVVLYEKTKGQRLSIRNIAKDMPWNSQLYFCGPGRMMDEAQQVCKDLGIPDNEVHFEAFSADVTGDPFEVVVANKGGRTLKVSEDESLLDVLKSVFDDVASSCEVGSCGTCKIRVIEGQVEHRGTALLEEEKADAMLSCVSRGVGRIVVEI